MFDNKTKRYMTRTISEELHMEIAIILWQLIDRLNEQEVELDYLQVFELSASEGKQLAITHHRQEIPERRETWIIPLEEAAPVARTVWCIDNDDGQMMLFPQDY